MTREEKKDIEDLIKKLSYCELEYQQNGYLSVGKFNAIKQAIQVIKKQQNELEKYQGIENGTTIIYKSKAKYVREDRILKYYVDKYKIREKNKRIRKLYR